ncbi:hypothetical protein [Streptomyces sp. NPDC020362]|uniref:hypothetical protein n=1 Tax=unclassified Streptomyces TaxID=2593676 RepID=UPI00340ED676
MAVLALGNSIFTGLIAHNADSRSKAVQRRADEAARKSQASLVTYEFMDNQSLTIENLSKETITNLVMVFKDIHEYMRFPVVAPCGWEQVQQLSRYNLTGTVFVRFLDSQNVAWEKQVGGDRAGLREVDSSDPPQGTTDITSTVLQTVQTGTLQSC